MPIKTPSQLRRPTQPFNRLVWSLVGLSALSLLFFAVQAARSHSLDYWYLIWNLFLAWIPLGLAFWLARSLVGGHRWSSWRCIALTLGWFIFLPNSFYMVSDFIHLQDARPSYILFDSLLFSLFIINGLILGYASLYLVQLQLRKRVSRLKSWGFTTFVLLSCSFAIYLGRDLRWNSWDVLVNPAGIIFDISERVLRPFAHPETFGVTLMFFAFLGGLYWVGWHMIKAIRAA
jgi:uncharacterized membrane protein